LSIALSFALPTMLILRGFSRLILNLETAVDRYIPVEKPHLHWLSLCFYGSPFGCARYRSNCTLFRAFELFRYFSEVSSSYEHRGSVVVAV
jgi:hypothetical protein